MRLSQEWSSAVLHYYYQPKYVVQLEQKSDSYLLLLEKKSLQQF